MLSLPLTFMAVFAGSAFAQTSLYIPGADPQPLIADILGVDEQGRTTWAVHQGVLTDAAEGGLPGTATLVEGPNDMSFTYVPPGGAFTLGRECSFSGDLAICSATFSGELVTATETIERIAVQIGTTAAPSTPTGKTDESTTAIPSQPASQPSDKPAQTSEKTSSAPSPTNTSNSGYTLAPQQLLSGLLISAATVALFLQF
ncbi:hypothetical protein D9615_009986 [Tricholomella constricta]|uniref:Uncharacterized protein n=1 Tax=Tricholomella constricta TaxID=117010 RepID=A0A8H5LTT8_9AGAR|nr:hypothetical protein D9615_009986 [Tricholomella constricta]